MSSTCQSSQIWNRVAFETTTCLTPGLPLFEDRDRNEDSQSKSGKAVRHWDWPNIPLGPSEGSLFREAFFSEKKEYASRTPAVWNIIWYYPLVNRFVLLGPPSSFILSSQMKSWRIDEDECWPGSQENSVLVLSLAPTTCVKTSISFQL